MEKAYSTEDLDSKVSEESQCYSEHDPVLPDQLWTRTLAYSLSYDNKEEW
jgi:hypothetical protein